MIKKREGKKLRKKDKNNTMGIHNLYTFVNDNVGKDIPTKKPKTTPITVVTISLILSFGFLLTGLQS